MSFLYFSSVVTYRVPIDEQGKPGNPEILKKFTTETYAPKKAAVPKKAPKKTLLSETQEVDYR